MDLTTPEGVAAYMEQSTSDEDWNRRLNVVKAENGGYPSFWYATCIASGLYERVSGSRPEIGVTNLDAQGNVVSERSYDAITGKEIS